MVAASLCVRAASIGLSTKTGAPAFVMAVQAAARIGPRLNDHRATTILSMHMHPGIFCSPSRYGTCDLVQRGVPRTSIARSGHWARQHRIHTYDPHTLSEPCFRSCFATTRSAIISLVDDLGRRHSPCVTR